MQRPDGRLGPYVLAGTPRKSYNYNLVGKLGHAMDGGDRAVEALGEPPLMEHL